MSVANGGHPVNERKKRPPPLELRELGLELERFRVYIELGKPEGKGKGILFVNPKGLKGSKVED